MYLKKLEMLGFKSFADRTELVFQPGMTCIVGPNGCGKSNVVDAFKWIFGEQSAKGMRGSEMKDVIFNGTMERKPTGFAEVTIIFENSDRFLDIDYAEVAITRRLYRSGESEYLINKQKCRLRDIRELFMGTGIGQTSYSILEQGKIDALLQANHMERRHIFEEAAGISKYLAKKAETIRALLRVEENLTRLNDIIAEVEKRLQRVKAQASKARRYREVNDRLKELKIRLALDDYRESVVSRADISFRLHWAGFRVGFLEGLLAELLEASDAKGRERSAHDSSVGGIRDQLSAERLLAERARERLGQERRRATDLGAELERKQSEIEDTRTSLRQLHERVDTQRREVEGLATSLSTRASSLASFQAELEGARRRRERLDEELRERKGAVVGLLEQKSRYTNASTQSSAVLAGLKAQSARLTAVAESHRQQLEQESLRELQLRSEEARLRGEAQGLAEARARCEVEISRMSSSLEVVDRDLSAKVARLVEKKSRHAALKSLEEKLDGVGRGVQGILRRREEVPELAELRGLHGMVASLVHVERRYARAVEAVLGSRAHSLVVESQEGALQILDFARGDGSGAVEVISLDRVDHLPLERFPCQAGVLGPLCDRVQVSEDLEELFRRLLGNVVLVEDFDTAIALSRNGLRPFRLVTLAGEVVEPWGGLSIAGQGDAGTISRRSEMEDLEREVLALEAEEGTLRGELAAVKGALQLERANLERIREEAQGVSRALVQVESSLSELGRVKDRLGREVGLAEKELAEISNGLTEREQEVLRLRQELERVEQERLQAEEKNRELEASSREAVEAEGLAQEVLTEARLEHAQTERRLQGARDLLARDEANLEERQARSEVLVEEVALVSERQRACAEAITASEQELAQAETREQEVRQALEQAEVAGAAIREREQELRKEAEVVRQEIGAVQKDRESAHLRDQEEKHRRNLILERMNEEYAVDLVRLVELDGEGSLPEELQPLAVYLAPDPAWEREKARDEIRELAERLRRMGSVNLEALDELAELEDRYKFQLAQREDLVGSSKQLQGIIAEINKTSRELFLKTFEQVQVHFSDLFRKCFGGGKAELVLEEGLDVLEAGIDIVAKPPGKKITSLSLMSGGEKTMTTIALLFAIFRAKPGPFCILDEVDAPLDETNVRRFAVLLKDFLAQTQFVVVSHNKVTMAEANTLYGITMQEHGVSKRVAVELESYDPELAAPLLS